jgi:hypothetical protein
MSDPTPVEEHYVHGLMLLSSCFGREVCTYNPCACARSLVDEISRPLLLKIGSLERRNEELLRQVQVINPLAR